MSTYNPSDYKDVKSLGFEVDSAETWSSPPPYQ
jgi:hypothetical protein